MTVMTVSIIVSTMYLGVHWVTDVGAGIVVGVLAYVLGEWIGKGVHQRPAAGPKSSDRVSMRDSRGVIGASGR
jgi:hypothetical protein